MREILIKPAPNIRNKGCKKCFITHFQHHTFCRWEQKKNEKKKQATQMFFNATEEIMKELQNRILYLENEIDNKKKSSNSTEQMCNMFAGKSDLTNYPDLCFKSISSELVPDKLCKLKGGSKPKVFDTVNLKLSTLLSLFRSLQVFYLTKEHKKCNALTKSSL